ncbi:MAG: fumarylacetoacetate hydrolase family protein [Dehalococcoidia bacterium]|nr:fumarylacetoacetate hydrolase family protein [Dehalococcoidia bacterium]
MKLGSFRNHSGDTRIGVKLDEQLVDLTAAFEKYLVEECGVNRQFALEASDTRMPTSMLDLLRREEEGWADLSAVYSYIHNIMKKNQVLFSPSGDKINYGLKEVRLLTPIPQMYRIFNIGVNSDVFASMEKVTPPEKGYTCMFKKTRHCLIGPEDEVKWPISAKEVPAEIELGVIIGKTGKGISQADALDYVLGYVVSNDITAMDVLTKAHFGPGSEALPAAYYITLSKCPDTFEAVGPFIVTKDEIPDCQNINGEVRVNGEPKIKGNTKDMRVEVRRLIEFLSADMTFYPGDLISSGGMGTEEYPPHAFLKPGDVVEAELENIGILRNHVVA